MKSRTLKVNYIARVEGEGSLYLKIRNNRVADIQLKIFEAPRFFEGLLRGRDYLEAPDITARICGICPVAYFMSSSHALEQACGLRIENPIRGIRRLLYCGEWISSHMLHIIMLHLPDFFDCQDSLELAKQYPDLVKEGIQLKKIGNQIMTLLGGRSIHPVNVKVGGFYQLPSKAQFAPIKEALEWGLTCATKLVQTLAELKFEPFQYNFELVALQNADEYPFNEGKIASTKGLNINISEYDTTFKEYQVDYSTALQSIIRDGGPCLMGPMARYALNYNQLTPQAKKTADSLGGLSIVENPHKSILVRAVEVIFAMEEALNQINEYSDSVPASVPVAPKAGIGYGATEAPRGTCYNRYEITEDGTIIDAKIVPPTAVNQKAIEAGLKAVLEPHIDRSDDVLQTLSERFIRSFDPCISCSTHFLKLNVER